MMFLNVLSSEVQGKLVKQADAEGCSLPASVSTQKKQKNRPLSKLATETEMESKRRTKALRIKKIVFQQT